MRCFILFSTLFLIVIMSSGCSIIGTKYNYGVTCKNIGTNTVIVRGFYLTKADNHSFAGGCTVFTTFDQTALAFYQRPDDSVIIDWKDYVTGKSFRHNVTTQLPKEFNPKSGHEVVFYFDPDNGKVHVSYIVRTESGEKEEITSNGKPFDIKAL